MPPTRPLDPIEIRVLGALLEKEQATPDYYPMTINAVIAACNQKSNRDPVMQLTETQVVEALDRLFQDVLAWRSTGARAERWEHRLDRRWHLNAAKKAVMTLLLLRGPQTVGELKTRSQRLHNFESLGEVEHTLQQLAEGFDALVRELPRQPGKRETRWTHLVAIDQPEDEIEATAVPTSVPATPAPVAAPPEPEGPTPVERLDLLETEVAELREELRALRERLGDL